MDTLNLIGILTAVLFVVYLYLKKSYTYWANKGVEYLETQFYYGNIKKMAKGEVAFGEQFQELYKQLKDKGVRYGGVYLLFKPVFIPIDPELIKCILQKDFNHFVNHGMYVNEEADPLSGHLFNLEDTKWRNLRVKLTPTFTSGKMKMMFQTLVECSSGLQDLMNDHSIVQDPMDIKDVLGRFTTDVIGSCAFGLDCNSLKNPDSDFRKFGKKIFERSFTRKMKEVVMMLIPKEILIKVGFKQVNSEVEAFFMKMVKDTVDYREKNKIFRKDFMHLLLQLKNRGRVNDNENIDVLEEDSEKSQYSMTTNEIAAQCFVFFIAGFETSATTMTFALYELAKNPDVQEKLRDDIRSTLKNHNGKITYESIMEMSYLDKVINETLRKYPPAPGTVRVCNKDYTIPGTDVVIEEKTQVHIPIIGLHRDPEYYPNPEVFDPERFNEENKSKRPSFTFIPFGEGPRICIGLRFGVMQSKVGLAVIINNFRVTVNEKTKTPLRFDPASPILSVAGGVWLNASRAD